MSVYETGKDKDNVPKVRKIAQINIPYPIDNLSQDANGDIFAAVLPKAGQTVASMKDPFNLNPPSAVVKITKDDEGGWTWTKVIEDANGDVLPGSTVAIHDSKTGRLFLSGKSFFLFATVFICSRQLTACMPFANIIMYQEWPRLSSPSVILSEQCYLLFYERPKVSY